MVRDDRPGYWRATRWLMAAALALWLVLGPGAYLIAARLTEAEFAGLPVGYLLAALISPIGLVGLSFWFADRQDKIDRDYGMADEE